MRIRKLTLPTSDVSKSVAFFRELLELPATESSIRVGWSEIRLVPAIGEPPRGVHLAFNVGYERFDAAMSWLKQRTPLQRVPESGECAVLEGDWQSKSVYFEGPDNAVLELIGRRRLAGSSQTGPFGGSDLDCVSEVGVPADDVVGTAAEFARTFAVTTLGQASPSFAAIGDDEGLVIAVAPDRPWFPERRQLPSAKGLEILLEGVKAPGMLVNPLRGWKVHAV